MFFQFINEIVFSYDGKIITDVNNMGTYNFYAWWWFDTINHFKYDVSPWKEWWSWPNNTNSLR